MKTLPLHWWSWAILLSIVIPGTVLFIRDCYRDIRWWWIQRKKVTCGYCGQKHSGGGWYCPHCGGC